MISALDQKRLSKMDKTIQMAKSVLAEMFQINIEHFEKHTTRTTNVAEARRFLIYYLIQECNVKHLHVKHFIPALKNHATSIHHFNKMKDLISIERQTKETYLEFKERMEKDGHTLLVKEYQKVVQEYNEVAEKLATLKNMI